MKSRRTCLYRICGLAAIAIFLPVATVHGTEVPGLISRDFLYEKASFPECHASTIAETPEGLIAAWFGGTEEKHPDVGIWISHFRNKQWSAPEEVATGVQYVRADGSVHRHPTWNPVLFQYPEGPLVLYWKCGPDPASWWGMSSMSGDHGKTWTPPCRLPEHIDGPVRNKPVLLRDGTLLCGSSTESDGWRVHFERTADFGRTWQRTAAIHDGKAIGAIQPALLTHPDGTIQALCRNQNGSGQILSTSSGDGGLTWTELEPTALPNPNSGIDAVTLKSGSHLLVYNHTWRGKGTPQGREMINLASSEDGRTWKAVLTLEQEAKSEFSYPAIIQTADGLVHITYTWKRQRIVHAVVDPQKLSANDIVDGQWPEDVPAVR